VGFVVALFFYHPLFNLIDHPYREAQDHLGKGKSEGVTFGVGAGFSLYVKICGFAALIGTAPIWLYQIWAFILPGLLPRERRWSFAFIAVAGPLFLVGVAVAYLILPKGIQVLIDINPHGVKNLVEFNDYLSFFLHTMVVFGIAFEVPVFVAALNLIGILPARTLRRIRPWIIIGIFVFAGAATPTTDPFTMLAMAVPMCLLYGAAEVFAHVHDRRKADRGINAGLDPDQPSDLSGMR
jgi:sec-independent protein translocase protein TatC